MSAMSVDANPALELRKVLGNYPTGVSVITGIASDGEPIAMVVGTFTSVSLDPPLVGYLPMKDSSSFAKLSGASTFCVNILAADQEQLARSLSVKSQSNKLDSVAWTLSPGGAPILEGSVSWIECETASITDAGDHYFVLGTPVAFDTVRQVPPLIFFQGAFGEFQPSSFKPASQRSLIPVLKIMEHVQDSLDSISNELNLAAVAMSRVEEDVIIIGGSTSALWQPGSLIGRRMPYFPPFGSLFVIDGDERAQQSWVARLPGLTDENKQRIQVSLERVKERDWSIAFAHQMHPQLDSLVHQFASEPNTPALHRELVRVSTLFLEQYEPADEELDNGKGVRIIGVPIRDKAGKTVLQLSVLDIPEGKTRQELDAMIARLQEYAAQISKKISQ